MFQDTLLFNEIPKRIVRLSEDTYTLTFTVQKDRDAF